MRTGQLLLIGCFLAFIYGGLVLFVAFGGPDTVSETENRTLTEIPRWSIKALWSGEYFRGLENYTADHVAFRDRLVGASMSLTSWQGLAGKDDAVIVATDANNGADAASAVNSKQPPQGSGQAVEDKAPPAAASAFETGQSEQTAGRVIGKVLVTGSRAMGLYSYSPAAARTYADTINRLQEALQAPGSVGEVRIFTLLAPTAVEFVKSPALRSLSDSQQQAIESVYRILGRGIVPVRTVDALRRHTGEELYFRTDHHWTATGAYYAYEAFMNARRSSPVPLARYERLEVPGFLGSLYTSTLNKRLKSRPDTIVCYKPFVKHDYVVHYAGPLRMKLLDMYHAGRKNKYRIFLSGDRPWGKITTESSGPRIAVVKDSYGNAFIPFLLPHYSEIHIIDPRQFRQSLPDFIRKQRIDEVLLLNNAEVTSHSGFTRLIGKLIAPMQPVQRKE